MKKAHLSQYLLDIIYPIGSLYFTVVDDTAQKVHNRFGGNWELFGAGRTPVCVDTNDSNFNTVEKTGGEKTHTLTINEMPSHKHERILGGGNTDWPLTNPYGLSDGSGVVSTNYAIVGSSSQEYFTANRSVFKTNVSGGGQSHNNLQPYKTCYIWKRVAD